MPLDVRKSSAFPLSNKKIFAAVPPFPVRISRDTPCYNLTSVAKDRLPIFQTDKIKQIEWRPAAQPQNVE